MCRSIRKCIVKVDKYHHAAPSEAFSQDQFHQIRSGVFYSAPFNIYGTEWTGGWDDGGGINCRSEDRGGELRDHVSVSMDFDLFDLSPFQK